MELRARPVALRGLSRVGPAPVLAAPRPRAPRLGGRARAARSQPGGATAQSCRRPRAPSRCRSRRWSHSARHLCLRRPPEKFVVRSGMDPLVCGSGAGKRRAVVMAPRLPAAAAPRSCSARRTPPPSPAWALGTGPSAGNRELGAGARAPVRLQEKGEGLGWGREEAGGIHRGHRRAGRWQGAEPELGEGGGCAWGLGGATWTSESPVQGPTQTRSRTPVKASGWRERSEVIPPSGFGLDIPG